MRSSGFRAASFGASLLLLALASCADNDVPPGDDKCRGAMCVTPTDPPDAIVTVTPEVIQRGDDFTTLITLDGSQSTGGGLEYTWMIPEARLEEGSTLTSGVVRFRLPGSGNHQWALMLRNEIGADSASGEVRVNTPPNALAGEGSIVQVGATAQLDGSASNDPDGQPITHAWTIASAPTGSTAALSAMDSATPTFVPDVQGAYVFELIVSDAFSASQPARVRFLAEPTELDPPVVTINAEPPHTEVGVALRACAEAVDASPIARYEVTVGGASIIAGPDGCFDWTPTERGRFVAQAKVWDNQGNVGIAERPLYAHDGPDDGPPTVQLSAPNDGVLVDRETDATGRAVDGDLIYYALELAAEGTTAFRPAFSGVEPVDGGVLGRIVPLDFLVGTYEARLCAEDTWANRACTPVRELLLSSPGRVGVMSLGFMDVHYELFDIPLDVMRTYDSRDKAPRDFGVGWQMIPQWEAGFAGPSDPAGGWDLAPDGCILGGGQTLQQQDKIFIISLGTKRYAYAMGLNINGPGPTGSGSCIVDVTFEPLGPTPQAASFSANGVELEDLYYVFGSGQLMVADEFGLPETPWRTRGFTLTTVEGTRYELVEGQGISAVTDRMGRRYRFDNMGVHNESGGADPITFVRDGEGRIEHIDVADGRTRDYVYNSAGNLIRSVDPTGVVTRYVYDLDHNLIEVIDPRGFSPGQMVYDDRGRLVGIVDDRGNTTTITHDDEARRTTIVDALGRTTSTEYDEGGRVTRLVDPMGGEKSFTYDPEGRPSTSTDALGRTSTYGYDESGAVNRFVDGFGNETTMVNDEFGRTRSIRDALGRESSVEYDPMTQNLAAAVDARGARVDLRYGPNGELTAIMGPEGSMIGMRYDEEGRIAGYTTSMGTEVAINTRPDGQVTSERRTVDGVEQGVDYEYDAAGRLMNLTGTDGRTGGLEYNEAGMATAVRSPDGTMVRAVLDGQRMRGVVGADGEMMTLQQDAAGRLTGVSGRGQEISRDLDANGNVLSVGPTGGMRPALEYDIGGRPTRAGIAGGPMIEIRRGEGSDGSRWEEEVGPFGVISRTEYDRGGRISASVAPGAGRMEFVYDALDNPTEIRFADGSTRTIDYDMKSRPIRLVDEAGRVTEQGYDPGDRLTSITLAGRHHEYGYDGGGLLASVGTDGTTLWTYTHGRASLDAPNERTAPWGGTDRLYFDGEGRPSRSVDGAGRDVAITYGPGGVLATRGPWTFTSNSAGAVTEAVGPGGARYVILYDAEGQPLRVESDTGEFTAQTWTPTGRINTFASPHGSLSYTYDENGRVSGIEDIGGSATNFSYGEDLGVSEVRHPNGLKTTYTRNDRGLTTAIRVTRADGTEVWAQRYDYDPSGLLRTVTAPGDVVTSYEYDEARRLVSEAGAPGDVAYGYSDLGDLITRGETQYTAENTQVTSDGTCTYAYDEAGLLKNKTCPAGMTTYNYDALGQLVLVEQPTAPRVVEMDYDHDGLLRRIRADGVERRLVWDRNGAIPLLAEEVAADGSLIARYSVEGLGTIVRRGGDGSTLVLHRDGAQNITLVTDGEGNLVRTISYDPFGRVRSGDGPGAARFGFAGEYYVEELGFYYMRARFYDPQLGRFTTPDPLGVRIQDPLTLNAYVYANNSPTNFVDPTGEEGLIGQLAVQFIISTLIRIVVPTILNVATSTLVASVINGKFSVQFPVGLVIGGSVNAKLFDVKRVGAHIDGAAKVEIKGVVDNTFENYLVVIGVKFELSASWGNRAFRNERAGDGRVSFSFDVGAIVGNAESVSEDPKPTLNFAVALGYSGRLGKALRLASQGGGPLRGGRAFLSVFDLQAVLDGGSVQIEFPILPNDKVMDVVTGFEIETGFDKLKAPVRRFIQRLGKRGGPRGIEGLSVDEGFNAPSVLSFSLIGSVSVPIFAFRFGSGSDFSLTPETKKLVAAIIDGTDEALEFIGRYGGSNPFPVYGY